MDPRIQPSNKYFPGNLFQLFVLYPKSICSTCLLNYFINYRILKPVHIKQIEQLDT